MSSNWGASPTKSRTAVTTLPSIISTDRPKLAAVTARWTLARLDLVDDLVARMVGHRTRLMQSTDLHGDEDRALSAYLAEATRLDAMAVPLGVMGRAWLRCSRQGRWRR